MVASGPGARDKQNLLERRAVPGAATRNAGPLGTDSVMIDELKVRVGQRLGQNPLEWRHCSPNAANIGQSFRQALWSADAGAGANH